MSIEACPITVGHSLAEIDSCSMAITPGSVFTNHQLQAATDTENIAQVWYGLERSSTHLTVSCTQDDVLPVRLNTSIPLNYVLCHVPPDVNIQLSIRKVVPLHDREEGGGRVEQNL